MTGRRLNVEIKARCADLGVAREVLAAEGARCVGEDHQIDTYFCVQNGRLKLREGIIERYLIFYDRPDNAGPKRSDVHLYEPQPGPALKVVLTRALGVRVVVEKRREIFFVGNVKFHLDQVDGLGRFVEIEAIDQDGSHAPAQLRAQCETFVERLGLPPEALVAASYSDLLLRKDAP